MGRLDTERLESRGAAQARFAIGPDGGLMTHSDLPPLNTQRWVTRRKAQVVAAVQGGLLTLSEACSRYSLTVEEFLSWQHAIERHGMAGLRATRVQEYRLKEERHAAH
ncbi:MAG TPA: DUF1153 domain-containing protein [Rhizomicrobium sp.]|jgi:hypothetical protein